MFQPLCMGVRGEQKLLMGRRIKREWDGIVDELCYQKCSDGNGVFSVPWQCLNF
mgnify:CR=1 FL=1